MSLSPYDAVQKVTLSPDTQSARLNRFGIMSSQKGSCINVHFPTQEEASQEFDRRLEELRRIYSTPAYHWSGKYEEKDDTPSSNSPVLRRVSLTNLRKDGKRGGSIHTLQLYKIQVSPTLISQVSEALGIPVLG
jgi:hypothetical protein